MARFCINCGAVFKNDNLVECPNCGHVLKETLGRDHSRCDYDYYDPQEYDDYYDPQEYDDCAYADDFDDFGVDGRDFTQLFPTKSLL